MTAKILCSLWNVNEHIFSKTKNIKGKHVKNVKMHAWAGVARRSEDIQFYLVAAQRYCLKKLNKINNMQSF
jgi:hypothetical protein